MDLIDFKRSLTATAPPDRLTALQEALWHDARGEWQRAHEIAQDIETADGSWVHAYLHRKEGDISNAAYWYSRAGRRVPSGTIEEEWDTIVAGLLTR